MLDFMYNGEVTIDTENHVAVLEVMAELPFFQLSNAPILHDICRAALKVAIGVDEHFAWTSGLCWSPVYRANQISIPAEDEHRVADRNAKDGRNPSVLVNRSISR